MVIISRMLYRTRWQKSIKHGLILCFAELHGVAISKGHTNTQSDFNWSWNRSTQVSTLALLICVFTGRWSVPLRVCVCFCVPVWHLFLLRLQSNDNEKWRLSFSGLLFTQTHKALSARKVDFEWSLDGHTHAPPECVDCINCCHMIICLSAFQKSYLLVCCVGDCFLKWYMHSYAHVLRVMCICEHRMPYKHIPGGLSVHIIQKQICIFFISQWICVSVCQDCTFNPQNSRGDREMACLCVCAYC